MKHPFVFRPLLTFPRPETPKRRVAAFDSTIEQTYKLLGAEIKTIKAMYAVVQLRLGSDGLRVDGMPKVALPPEVVLCFEREFEGESAPRSITMPCDTFSDWRDNLRALALSLEALRKVDRYGVTQNGEQYRGWEALPAAASDEEEDFRSSEDARAWLRNWSDLEDPLAAYRYLARTFHPDAGGDAAKFRLLQKAKEVLGL